MNEKKKNQGFYFKRPAIYRIVVEGELDDSWSERLGLQITFEKKAGKKLNSFLVGRIADQASLSSILNLLYDMHMTVISVNMLTDVEDD
ncbi:MAG: hypothetical protein QM503_13555 [Bacteroidota bacterium]